MINKLISAGILLAVFTSPVLADTCQDDVAALEKALGDQELDSDIRAQAEDMKSQAVQLCGAGNTEEGLAVTAEAKVLLKVE